MGLPRTGSERPARTPQGHQHKLTVAATEMELLTGA